MSHLLARDLGAKRGSKHESPARWTACSQRHREVSLDHFALIVGPRTSLPFGDPDVAGHVIAAEKEAIPSDGQPDSFRRRRDSLQQRMPNLVKMPDGEGAPDEALARRIQALRPDTSKSVALRKQVQQIAIGRPGRDQIFRRTIRNRDPRTAALVVRRIECRNEYPARAGWMARAKCDPITRW